MNQSCTVLYFSASIGKTLPRIKAAPIPEGVRANSIAVHAFSNQFANSTIASVENLRKKTFAPPPPLFPVKDHPQILSVITSLRG